MRALRQTFVLIWTMFAVVDQSVKQAPTNFTVVIKSTNAYVQSLFHHTLLITVLWSSEGWLYKCTRNAVCHIEYSEPLTSTIMVDNPGPPNLQEIVIFVFDILVTCTYHWIGNCKSGFIDTECRVYCRMIATICNLSNMRGTFLTLYGNKGSNMV
jgi:hypothetical protein